ncbi:MAG: glucose-1-phosphate thymidylyltransferase [Firmicutes bacterium HGW-Firmicutes-1]|jgi:glucose-1-phosphate thymidylyltransferase|nr:MAG: glucose-1-phosphate thymidylyltransferase [Firmicutes bacterium HGW-Firmicutes-1]
MKGIILAGGYGTRLFPMTKVVSKQLLPIYDKPMIYYPLSVLMMANIRKILIISTPKDIVNYQILLGDGSQLGMDFSYKIQEQPRGLADAFIVGETFIRNSEVALILGDNVFCGEELNRILDGIHKEKNTALIFAYPVTNPSEFGVVEFDVHNNVKSIEEKPVLPKSHYAVPGLYFYNNHVIEIAKNIKASDRGELEITDVNLTYMKRQQLKVKLLDESIKWFDTGSCSGLLEASKYIHKYQNEKNKYIGCIEEIAFSKGYINEYELIALADGLRNADYGKYLLSLFNVKKEVLK